jgi:hypothetical protein
MSEEMIDPNSQGLAQVAPEARALVKEALMGPGMRRLKQQRESAYIDLKNSGRLKPATILNFNPVSLKVDDGHVPWRVPAAIDKLKKSITLEHGGRTYEASIFTVREPSFVPWIRDVRPPSDEGENPSSEYDPVFILPLELLDQYRIMYTEAAGQILMGGVIAFEGDLSTFKNVKETIRVPQFTTLPDRKRSYFSKEVDFAEELKTTLDMQKAYCQRMIQQGDEYFQDEVQAKNITAPHRIWAQFAMTMGWKQVAPAWMNAQLESEESCKGCGKGKKRTDAWFCDCGRPYNPFAAFMAGENVPESYLFSLKGKELDKVLAELGRREELKARFRAASPTPPTAPPAL